MNRPSSWFSFPNLRYQLLTLGIILLAGIVDVSTPLGVAVGVLYVLPVITTLPISNSKMTKLVAFTATALILIGYWASSEGSIHWMVAANRVLSILAVWGTYYIVIQAIRASEIAKGLSKTLEDEQIQQTTQLEEKHRAMLNLLEDFSQAQHRIKISEERFELAMTGTNEGIWDWVDVNQNPEWWSPQFYRLLGYQPDEFPAGLSKFKELLHPDDHERTFQLVQAHFESKVPFSLEYRLLTKTGQYHWFQGHGHAIRDDTGHPIRMVGAIRDITERKEAEAALSQVNRQIALILSSAGEGIYGLDLQGKTTFVNPAASTMLGYEQNELIACPMHATIHHTKPDGKPYSKDDCPIHAAVLEGKSYHNKEETLWRKDGSSIQVDYTSTPIFGEHHELFGAVVLFKDSTLRHKAEQERQEFITELESKNTELEQFAHTVSHDLKSPLVTIRGFIGFLKKGLIEENTDHMQNDLQRIDSAAAKMQVLLENLLELSRVGQPVGSFEDVALTEVAQEALELIHGFHEQKLQQTVHVHQTLPVIQGNHARLVELFQNLLENAFKFLGKQPDPCIEVDVRQDKVNHVIVVRDNGIGIEPEYQQRVFEIFERLQTEVSGTGVGLAIAKKIVMLHHGRIWIESEGYEKGTTVCLAFPIHSKR